MLCGPHPCWCRERVSWEQVGALFLCLLLTRWKANHIAHPAFRAVLLPDLGQASLEVPQDHEAFALGINVLKQWTQPQPRQGFVVNEEPKAQATLMRDAITVANRQQLAINHIFKFAVLSAELQALITTNIHEIFIGVKLTFSLSGKKEIETISVALPSMDFLSCSPM